MLERRQGRGQAKLTAAGEALMRYYNNVNNESRRRHSEIESIQDLMRDVVHFGMPESLTRDLMPRFLARFSHKYPGVSFKVHVAGSPTLGKMVLDDKLDACFAFGDIAFKDLSVVYSRLLPLYVAGAQGPSPGAGPDTPAQ